jgi:hypothetical protein
LFIFTNISQERKREYALSNACDTMVLMLLSSVVFGEDWILFSNDLSDGSLCYYDSQSINREGNTIKVLGNRMLSDNAKRDYIKNHKKYLYFNRFSLLSKKQKISLLPKS